MKKMEDKSGMTIVHSAFGASKPIAPFVGRQLSAPQTSVDPSSSLRTDRYPIPVSFEYRSNPRSRDLA